MQKRGFKLREKVRAGVRLLNERLGQGWQKRIDVEKLDMSSCYNCVLGQLYGNFHGSRLLRTHDSAVERGFAGGYHYDSQDKFDGYDKLNRAWLKYFEDLKRKR